MLFTSWYCGTPTSEFWNQAITRLPVRLRQQADDGLGRLRRQRKRMTEHDERDGDGQQENDAADPARLLACMAAHAV